jgi:hypothetical protein
LSDIDYTRFIIRNILDLENFDIYIILSCKPTSKNKSDQAGIYNFPALFQGLYRSSREKWLYCTAALDEYPDSGILKRIKAIIIPGSHISVYDNYNYLNKTKDFIVFINTNYNIKMLGICFGAQFIGDLYDGKVKPRKGEFFKDTETIKFDKIFGN